MAKQTAAQAMVDLRSSVAVTPAARIARIVASNQKPPEGDISKIVAEMRADDIFKLGVQVIRSKIEGASVSIDAVEVAPGEEAVVESIVGNLRQLWDRVAGKTIEGLEYGHIGFEQVWRWSVAGGYYALADLFAIPFYQSHAVISDDGCFEAVHVGPDEGGVTLPRRFVWWFANEEAADNINGTSIYSGGPTKILGLRKTHEEFEKVFISRFSLGTAYGYAPSEPSAGGRFGKGQSGEINNQAQLRDPMGEFEKAVADVYAGGFLLMAGDRDKNGNRLFEFNEGRELKDATAIENRGKSLDVRALRSIGIPERSIIQDSDVGTQALAEAHGSILDSVCNGFLSQITASFQRDVIGEAVRINGLRSRLEVSFIKIGDRASEQAAQILDGALKSPVPPSLAMIALDIERLIEGSGLPLADGARERIQTLINNSLVPAQAPAL